MRSIDRVMQRNPRVPHQVACDLKLLVRVSERSTLLEAYGHARLGRCS